MNTPENGNRTRRELAKALKTLLKRKPLEQMRVRELTELCGLRRQSFYYHFKDVYDLFDWAIRQEQAYLRGAREDCLTWRQAMGAVLERAAEERAFYQAVLRYRGRAGLREVFLLSEPLEAALAYYRTRSGLNPSSERARVLCWETVLLSLLEGWISDDLDLTPEELLPVLEDAVIRKASLDAWETLWNESRQNE